MSIRQEFGRVCRETRIQLDVSQQALADAAAISRGYLAHVECGSANLTIGTMERIARALDIQLDLSARRPIFLADRRRRDVVHARCSSAVDRRLTGAGWLVEREVHVSDGRVHGWIDLLALHPETGTLVVVELKTEMHDIGAMERQVGMYERHALGAARRCGWRPRSLAVWLIGLWSVEVDQAIVTNQEAFARFPARAMDMLKTVRGAAGQGRGVALLDPRSHRADWLVRTRLDGRRSRAPFGGYADAARALAPNQRRRA